MSRRTVACALSAVVASLALFAVASPALVQAKATAHAASTTVNVTAVDFKFKLSAKSAKPGKVTFKNGATSLGAATLDSTGTATLTKTNLPAGTDLLTASYGGDALNAKSTSTAVSQTVNQAQIMMTLSSSPNPSIVGKSVKFTATLSSNGGLPNGQTVTFSLNGTTLRTATVSGGNATLSTTTLPVGSDVVTAAYAGDANHTSASVSVTQTVN